MKRPRKFQQLIDDVEELLARLDDEQTLALNPFLDRRRRDIQQFSRLTYV